MAIRLSVVETLVSPSFRVFRLHARADGVLGDMQASAERAAAEDVGFAASAVAVATVADPGSVRVTAYHRPDEHYRLQLWPASTVTR